MSPDSHESSPALEGQPFAPHSEWTAVLDQFERSLDSSDPHPSADWQPPASIGPLPEHLRARAERVLERQQRQRAELESRADELAKHLRALNAVPVAGEQAVFVDVTG